MVGFSSCCSCRTKDVKEGVVVMLLIVIGTALIGRVVVVFVLVSL